jgi:hypothetical protein
MFVPHFDFRLHTLIQHGTMSIGKNAQGKRERKTSSFLFGRYAAASAQRKEERATFQHAVPSPAEVPVVELNSDPQARKQRKPRRPLAQNPREFRAKGENRAE